MPLTERKPISAIPGDIRALQRYFRDLSVAPDPNSVSAGTIQANAVTTAKVADAAVTTTKVADSAVTAGKIADSNVTYAKIQNISATDKLLGRATAGAGVVEEIDCTAAGRALLDDASATAQRTTLGLGTAATQNTGTSGATVPLLNGANTWALAQSLSAPPVVPSYTVGSVPSASPAAQVAYVSNESGGAVLAFSDGTNWRRVTDRAIIS
jgi:hypothetical protein